MRVAVRLGSILVGLCAWAGVVQAQCVGDCNNDNAVAVNELVTGVNILLEVQELSRCEVLDADDNGVVAINELVQAVNNLLGSCEGSGNPTPTPTQTVTPTVEPGVCAFNGAAENNDSSIQLCSIAFGGACIPFDISGAVKVECGTTGANGLRDCTCELNRFDVVELPSIGFVCVDPAEGCPAGQQDCDGGTPFDIEVSAHAEIGACTSPAECDAACDTFCAGQGMVQFNSGCELFCQGGDRDGQECKCDVLGASGCRAENTLDCPGGSCVGKNDEPDRDCQCQCINEAAGEPAAAGAMNCRLGTGIRVEPVLPCNNDSVLVRLPPLCAALTSEGNTGALVGANENPADMLTSDPLAGEALSCAAVDAGDLRGLRLVTNLAFFDSTIGDLFVPLIAQCE